MRGGVPDTRSAEALVQEAVTLGTLQFYESTNSFSSFAKMSLCRVSAALKSTDCCSPNSPRGTLTWKSRAGMRRRTDGWRDGKTCVEQI